MTTFQTDYNTALYDTNVIGQVKAAILSYCSTVYTEGTAITSASNAVALPAATINVGATAGIIAANGGPSGTTAGSFTVQIGTTTQTISYTGTTGTTFTGCTGGTGTLATGQIVLPGNHTKRAQLATSIANGLVLDSFVLSAVTFATLGDASTDTTVSNAVAALFNQWAGS